MSKQELEMTVLMLKKENEQLKKGLMKVIKDGDASKLKEILETDMFKSISDGSPRAKVYFQDDE